LLIEQPSWDWSRHLLSRTKMPAFLEKRPLEEVEIHSSKKAKLTEVQTKVNKVVAALSNDDFQVDGSTVNRQMLLALAPCILATPREGRHHHQEEFAGVLKEVFLAEGARLQEHVHRIQPQIDGAGADMATRKAAVEAADSDLQANATDLKGKLSLLAARVGVTQTAKETFNHIVSELAYLEEIKEIHVLEQQDVAAKVESFATFIDGSLHEADASKDQLKALGSFFRKLKVDSSLVAALPDALGHKPEERSQFDLLTVSALDKELTSKVDKCATLLQETIAAIVEKTAAKDAAEAALADALERQTAGAEAILQSKDEQKKLTAILAEKNKIVLDGQFEFSAVEAEYLQKTSELKLHVDVQDVLTELLAGQGTVETVQA